MLALASTGPDVLAWIWVTVRNLAPAGITRQTNFVTGDRAGEMTSGPAFIVHGIRGGLDV